MLLAGRSIAEVRVFVNRKMCAFVIFIDSAEDKASSWARQRNFREGRVALFGALWEILGLTLGRGKA